MKRIMYALVLLFCFATAFSQNIYIANSNPGAAGGTRVFTGQSAIGNAVTAASNGDIIYVVPSNVHYFQFNLFGKSVSLIGGGFNPDKPGGPLSTIENIFGLASNIRISGLVVTGTVSFGGVFSNIIIEKCRIGNLFQGSSAESTANLIIQNCIIGENNGNAIHLANESSNVVISNNIVYGGPGAMLNNLNGAIVRNNLFVGTPGFTVFGSLAQCNIQNNIFYFVNVTPAGIFTDNDQVNNLISFTSSRFITTGGNTSSGNIEDQDPMFSNFSLVSPFSFSFDLTLQTGSPAIGSGLGGIDMGVFGGPNAFDIHGTSLPLVQNIIAPNTVPQGSTMNVRIQAKGN